MSVLAASARVRAAHLLAQPRGGGLHLHLPAAPVLAARLGLLGRDRDRRGALPSGDVLLAGLFGYGAANTAFAGLAIILVDAARDGILKRLRSTPLAPATYIAAVLSRRSSSSRSSPSRSSRSARFVFDAEHARELARLRRAVLLGAACFAGPRRSAPPRSSARRRASPRSSTSIVLPMAFLSGSFGPTDEYPAFLQAIADVLPLKYFLDVVNGVYLDGRLALRRPGGARHRARRGASAGSRSPSGASAGCRASER